MFLFRFGVGVVAVLGLFVFSLLLSGLVCSVFCLLGRFGLFWGGLLFCLGYCLFVCGGLFVCLVFALGSFLIFYLDGWLVGFCWFVLEVWGCCVFVCLLVCFLLLFLRGSGGGRLFACLLACFSFRSIGPVMRLLFDPT